MTAPTYDQLVDALDRVVAAHHADPDDERGGVAAVLNEIEASIEHAADLAGRASRQEQAPRTARRLPAPTGQPVEFDPDTPPPAHARGVARTVPNMRRVT